MERQVGSNAGGRSRLMRASGTRLLVGGVALLVMSSGGVLAAEPRAAADAGARASGDTRPPNAAPGSPSVAVSIMPESQTIQILVADVPTEASADLAVRLAVVGGPLQDVTVQAFAPRAIGSVIQTSPAADTSVDVSGTTLTWRLAAAADGDELRIRTLLRSDDARPGDYPVSAAVLAGPCEGDGCLATANVSVVLDVPPAFSIDLRSDTASGGTVPPVTITFRVHLWCTIPSPRTIEVDVPEALGVPTAITGGGQYQAADNAVLWPAFACGEESFVVDVAPGVPPGSYTATARIVADNCPACSAQTTVTIGASPATPTPAPTKTPVPPVPTEPPTDTLPAALTRS